MEDKENICNIARDGDGLMDLSKSNSQQHQQKHQQQQQQPASPIIIDADLLMVSPLPPPPPNDLKTPTRPPTKSTPPPPNSENIMSAIRQAEQTLNAEIHNVNLLASTGGGTSNNSQQRRVLEDYYYDTSPESDCCRSPIPPSFPPMPSSMMGSSSSSSRSPTRSARRSSSSFHSPKRTTTTSATTTPMDYSSLNKTPTMSNSPLPNKSLLPILTTLEEEHHHSDTSGYDESVDDDGDGDDASFDGGGALFDAVDDGDSSCLEEGVETEQTENENTIVESESNSSDNSRAPMKVIEFDGANDDEESVESQSLVLMPRTSRRRRIIHEEESSESEDDNEEEEEEASEESVCGGMKENTIDFSKFNLNDDDNSSGASVASDKDETAGEAESSVRLEGNVPAKSHRRRIIDDDDGSIASEASDASEEDSHASSPSCKSNAKAEPLGDILGGGFSKLTIDESSQSSQDEDASFQGSADASSSTTTSKDEASHASSIDSASASSSSEGTIAEDDESVMCFDACGCWALDEENKGDLFLSNNTDVKWPKIRLPLALYNKLFQHQRIGVQWMASLHRNKIKGGILADDMGMGKTMQTLAYLGSLMRAQTISNAIIVCPKSVVRSWEREANLILKNMCVAKASVYAITSDMGKEKRKRIFTDAFCSSAKAPRLVITTYGLISSHVSDLNSIANSFGDHHWCYVVLDEGHLIKNRKTKGSQDVRILARSKKTRRLLLTGTPIQNNMKELHALFDWATSTKLLGSIQTFLNKYGEPIEQGRQRNASEWTIKKAAEMNIKLKKCLQPYFLQRLKKGTFQNELPEKKELVVFTQLSTKQRRMYEDYAESVFDGESSSPLAAVSWLKMLCGHPSLIKEAYSRYKNCDADVLLKDSSKLQVLLALIQRLKRSGHRALVFSQSTKMLDIMEKVFDGTISFLRIDGSSAEKSRQKAVDHFNDSSSGIDIMLLSTKAAGTGLTLTGADRAIIYDPSWNPAEDAQAVDRCYRIGQTKNVTVYRFIAAGTVEEKMYEKQVHKDGIKRVVLSSDSSTARYFDQSELADLFKLSPKGHCSMMSKFNEKDSNGAGSSGKPSFLTKHPSVIGVASHDVLYSNVSIDVDLTSPRSEETPFSRSPFHKSKIGGVKKHPQAIQIEDLTLDTAQVGKGIKGIKPLGGLNQTRQNRVDAKTKRNQEKNSTISPLSGLVENILSEVDALMKDKKHGKAMSRLLDLVETEMDSIKGDEKLAVHKNMSLVGSVLGWL